VPKVLRETVGLTPGAEVEIDERDGELTLRPVGPPVVAVVRDGRTVLTTNSPVPPMEHDALLRMIDESRAWPR
jgi:bifunctional DNA-binding transcriptional regulator/antitoxin component of YhaV-PrlF toxin-antitoxin module